MTQPLVSVCIPVFNCEAHIAQAVESVLSQTHRNLTLTVLDNCSEDRTREVLSTFSDTRMTVLVNEANIGAAGNWNRALELASGKYFKLLCADDYLYPECIETQVAALEDPANAAACMASARRDIVDARGRRIATRGFKGGGRLYAGREIIRRSIRRGTNIIGEPPCVLLRTETVGKKGGFDGSNPYLIDFDYWCRILLDGEIVMLDGPLSAFRVSKKSWSFDLSRRQADSFRRFAKKLPALGDIGLGGMDRLSCSLMAGVNEFMRCLFYKFFL